MLQLKNINILKLLMNNYSQKGARREELMTKQREQQQLNTWMNEYGNDILRLCYTYVHNWQTAEDLTQDTFLKVYKYYDQYRGEAHIRTYIYAVAINICKDYLSSWKYKKVVISNTFQQFLTTKQTVENVVEQKSEKQELVELIENLAPKYKDILLLFYFAECSLQEISEALHIPVNTVKTRLKRAREQLKGLLEEE